MLIYFVRHGHPDYAKDCLTELGARQAAAAAERLKGCGISRIYSSTMGRAAQTAGYTAALLGLEVDQLDFMREIGWRPDDGTLIPADGHPWLLSDILEINYIYLVIQSLLQQLQVVVSLVFFCKGLLQMVPQQHHLLPPLISLAKNY